MRPRPGRPALALAVSLAVLAPFKAQSQVASSARQPPALAPLGPVAVGDESAAGEGSAPAAMAGHLALFRPEERLRLFGDSAVPAEPGYISAEERSLFRRNFLIPAVEVVALVVGLNVLDRILGKDYSHTHGLNTLWHHAVHGPWKYDTDPLRENLVAHPYNGSLYYNFARSTGLSFWWSFGYAFAGSLLWELGGENQAPSINDQVITPLGGTLLGELLYRSFVLILQGGGGEAPGFWREVAAIVVSPAAGLNRLLFGDTYRTPEFDEQPAVFMMATGGVGFSSTRNPMVEGGSFELAAGAGTFEFEYGQPADPHFRVQRPFDSFRMDAALNGDREAIRDALRLRGLLAGWRLDGGAFRGVWGIFGQYDNVSGGIFRVITGAVGAGVTGEFGLSRDVALRSTAVLSGIPLGAADTTVTHREPRGYHLGPGAQLELHLRLYLGSSGMLDLVNAQYLVVGNSQFPGVDWVVYARLASYLRIAGPHTIGASATFGGRVAVLPDMADIHQRFITATINYGWISDAFFGAAPRRSAEGG